MKEFRKKDEFIQKFVEVMGEKRTNVAFHEAARKTLEELDVLDGAFIDDITIEDFEDSEINGARAVKIAQYVKDGRELSAGMIRDFLLVAGVEAVRKNDEEHNAGVTRRRNGGFVYPVWRLTNYNIDRLKQKSKKTGKTVSWIIDEAVERYFNQ